MIIIKIFEAILMILLFFIIGVITDNGSFVMFSKRKWFGRRWAYEFSRPWEALAGIAVIIAVIFAIVRG